MAPDGPSADAPTRHDGKPALRRRPAGPLVAVRRRDRRARRRVGVAATRGPALMALWERLARVFGRGARERNEAERILLEADFGFEATDEILDRVSTGGDGGGDFRAGLERAVIAALSPAAGLDPRALARAPAPPTVMVIFGVNGVGKTTMVAKLGARLLRAGRSVLLAAADTFRPGAAEQLQIWADRLAGRCITGMKDPAAVAFDAIVAARARGIDTVRADTAGRPHTEEPRL